MTIDATIIDRIVARTIYDVEWWDYIGAEVSDDQWRLMQMGRLAGISELANALKEVLMADRKDEPQTDIPKSTLRTDCTGCRFVGSYDTEFPCVNCARKNKDYYDAEQTERSE